MRMSESIDQIATALAEAQKSISSPEKNREVSVKTDKGSYKFRYATLDCILDMLREPLTENGLWFTHTLDEGDGGKFRLVTTLLHKSGQWIASEQPLFVEKAGNNQAFGSALTYAKRYAVMGMFALSADDDDDANHADGNTVQSSRDRSNDATKAAAAAPARITAPKPQPPQQPAQAPETASGKPVEFDPHAPKAAMAGKPAAEAMQAFCGTFTGQVRAARTIAQLDELWSINEAILTRVQEKNPRAFDTVMEAFNARQAEVPGPMAGG